MSDCLFADINGGMHGSAGKDTSGHIAQRFGDLHCAVALLRGREDEGVFAAESCDLFPDRVAQTRAEAHARN
ncbi:hypothetical protein GCM10007385_41850 [Tateyamaria omphalii]|nr:hypothetical protein GCM10007385_41850 [Tateyamaria omphalii]